MKNRVVVKSHNELKLILMTENYLVFWLPFKGSLLSAVTLPRTILAKLKTDNEILILAP